jgi:hypothetical protein
MKREIRLVLLVSLVALFESCRDTQTLSAADKIAVDTLTSKATNRVEIEQQKWCADHRDSLVDRAVDSLIVLRRKQIARQLEDIKEGQ